MGEFIVAKYTEVEFLEWIENIPLDAESTVIVTSGQKYYTNYTYSVIPTLDNLSAEGWEVVSFTDTFNYLESGISRTLQRRKCYLLKKEDD
ncbi:hypothetical protein C7B69_05540 [filamentous cyanobacterium Phorm 46]|nr:hypothetical protein C7B69_05540 [filamentous cyanobacterium Phorm 46]